MRHPLFPCPSRRLRRRYVSGTQHHPGAPTLLVVLTGLVVGAVLAATPAVADQWGQEDCTEPGGRVAVTANFWSYNGMDYLVNPGGPTAPTWHRRVKPYGANPVSWSVVSPFGSGQWSAGKVEAGGPGFSAWSQCTGRPIADDPVKDVAGLPAKDCPAGQNVVIKSAGWGNHWLAWDGGPETVWRRVKHPQYQAQMNFYAADTGRNEVRDALVKALPSPVQDATPAKIVEASILCSDNAGTSGD